MKTITRNDYRIIITSILLLFMFLLAYWGPLKSLVGEWYADDDYSYGFLVPVISLYLIWERRRELTTTPVSINWWGGLFFTLFLFIGAYGILGSSPSAVRPSIPFILLSMVLFCFGWEYFKRLLFPLGFLIFMIPLPTVVESAITVPLKLVSTKLGGLILKIFGVSAFIQGNVIDLGFTQLQVVDACNGLRYILPLFALGVIFSYFFEKTLWKQVILVMITIPIAVFTNGLRIGATGILAQKYGPSVAEGFFHGFSGWIVFMFAFAMLVSIEIILRKINRPAVAKEGRIFHQMDDWDLNKSDWSVIPAIIVCICFLLLLGAGYSTKTLPRLSLKTGFSDFPMNIGPWSGTTIGIDSEMIGKSGAEEAFSAEYVRGLDEVVSLYIGYRGSPFLENANFFHSPSVCLPSSGWKTQELVKRTVGGVPGFGSLKVTEMVIEQTGSRQLVYYWFQTKNRSSHNVNLNRFHLSLHALKRDNTYDLFIRPITPIDANETVAQAEARMDEFVREMMETLLKYMPENQEPEQQIK